MCLAGTAPPSHHVGDAVGDGAGLAGAGSGQDADRPADRLGRGALLGVEPTQHALRHLLSHSTDTVIRS